MIITTQIFIITKKQWDLEEKSLGFDVLHIF